MWWHKVAWLIIYHACLTSAWLAAWAESLLERRVGEREGQTWDRADISEEDVRSSWTCVPVGFWWLVLALACSVFWGGGSGIIMAPGVHHISAHPLPTSSNSTTSLGTISSTLFLNQNISCHAMRHFGSCHLDPVLLALRVWWRKSLSNLWKGWHKHITQYVRHEFTILLKDSKYYLTCCTGQCFLFPLSKALDIAHRKYIFVLLCDDCQHFLQENIEMYLFENDSNFLQSEWNKTE